MNETNQKLLDLRRVITENLRIQRGGDKNIKYINVGTALTDVTAKQNHAIFARRGCGKTLLLHHSESLLKDDIKTIYLNCEDFKRHTFPNVLIEILVALFSELERHLTGWFGKKKKSRQIIRKIVDDLAKLQKSADTEYEDVRKVSALETNKARGAAAALSVDDVSVSGSASSTEKRRDEIERTFRIHKEKLRELDTWLPRLKEQVREFFALSSSVKAIFLQIDDLYHLRRIDQAFVIDYIHRLCKDIPLYFKVATLRHVSTLYLDRDGQPIGAQERHDYQPINIDYTFSDFKRTKEQNWQILLEFSKIAGMDPTEIKGLFKGEGFERLRSVLT